MGIKKLSEFLRKYEVYETLHISNLQYKKIGIDMPMFLYKFKSTGPHDFNWIGCFITLVAFLRKWNIHPIFIFEGKAPPEKSEAQLARKEARQKVMDKTNTIEEDLKKYIESGTISPLLQETQSKGKNRSILRPKREIINVNEIKAEIERRRNYEFCITPEDIIMVKELLKILGVSFVQSCGEAESDCINLLESGQIDYIVAEDTDVLAYYTKIKPVVILNFNYQENSFTQIQKVKVLDTLNLKNKEFRDFCIMCGTDYNKNIFRIGVEKSFKLISEFKSIENVSSSLDTSILNYVRVREIFTAKESTFSKDEIKWCRLPLNFKEFKDDLNIFIYKYGMKELLNIENIFKVLSTSDLEIEPFL